MDDVRLLAASLDEVGAHRDAVAGRLARDPELTSRHADRPALRRAVARALAAEGVVVAPAVWARLVRDLVDELGGLGPLQALLRDPDVTDVMCNGPHEVWAERAGTVVRVDVRFRDDDHLLATIRRALAGIGVRLDRSHPWADGVLDDGVRVHVIAPPLAAAPIVTLRRIATVVPGWDQLLAWGLVAGPEVELLRAAVRERRNLLVCGPAGAGKTTLLARLLADAAPDRTVVIEDAPELAAPGHVVHLRTRPPSPDGHGGVGMRELVRNALRMRPDRLVVGEVRGAEVADMLQAMNTGHAGSMTTLHANTAADALVRLEGMGLLAGLPLEAVRAQVATAVDVVVALGRDRDGTRRLRAIGRVRAEGHGWAVDA